MDYSLITKEGQEPPTQEELRRHTEEALEELTAGFSGRRKSESHGMLNHATKDIEDEGMAGLGRVLLALALTPGGKQKQQEARTVLPQKKSPPKQSNLDPGDEVKQRYRAMKKTFCCANKHDCGIELTSSKQCSRCFAVKYCSRECQLKQWKQHKRSAKRSRKRTIKPSTPIMSL